MLHVTSRAELCDIRTIETGEVPEIRISLLGTQGLLKLVHKLTLEAAAKKQDVAINAEFGPTGAHYGNTDTYLTLSFRSKNPGFDATEALALLHGATHCDIGASIKAYFHSEDYKKKSGEINTLFMPTADITLSMDSDETRAVVAHYLREKLEALFHGQYIGGKVAQYGLPVEYDEQHKMRDDNGENARIMLTFREAATTNGIKAKQMAGTIAEHLSGLLKIPEKVPQHQQSRSIPNH
ncbi:MAG: hypothetical protein EBV03_04440 [Proteobacteria bacterium]|nr:hypothetical protein [Pseudomonadota bacterium]